MRAAAGPRPGPGLPARRATSAFGDEQRGVTGRLGPPPGLAATISRAVASAPAAAPPGRRQLWPGRKRADGRLRADRRCAPGDRPDGGPAGHRADQRLVKPGRVRLRVGNRPSAVLPAGQWVGRGPGNRSAGRPSPTARGDWGERTERIDRVNAAGYPEPRGEQPQPGTRQAGRVGRRRGVRSVRRRSRTGYARPRPGRQQPGRQGQARQRQARRPGPANAGPPRARS